MKIAEPKNDSDYKIMGYPIEYRYGTPPQPNNYINYLISDLVEWKILQILRLVRKALQNEELRKAEQMHGTPTPTLSEK